STQSRRLGMLLHFFEVDGFIRSAFRQHDTRSLFLFFPRPFRDVNHRNDQRQIGKRSAWEFILRPLWFEGATDTFSRSGANLFSIAVEFPRHATLDSQADMTNLKSIPLARAIS